MDSLEGEITVTVGSTQGKFRQVRLAAKWEEQFAASGSKSWREKKSTHVGVPTNVESSLPPSILDDPELQQSLLAASREGRKFGPT